MSRYVVSERRTAALPLSYPPASHRDRRVWRRIPRNCARVKKRRLSDSEESFKQGTMIIVLPESSGSGKRLGSSGL